MNKAVLAAGLLVLLAGCGRLAPASVPPQLTHTPGPPVVVAGATITTTAFTVANPAGWRVITSASFVPVTVVLVRPDESALMVFSVEAGDVPPLPVPPEDGDVFTERVTRTLPDGTTVYAALRGPAASAARLRDLFAVALDTLRPPG